MDPVTIGYPGKYLLKIPASFRALRNHAGNFLTRKGMGKKFGFTKKKTGKNFVSGR